LLRSIQVRDEDLGAAGLRNVDLLRPVAFREDDRAGGVDAPLEILEQSGELVRGYALEERKITDVRALDRALLSAPAGPRF